jgi:hypothetical protein
LAAHKSSTALIKRAANVSTLRNGATIASERSSSVSSSGEKRSDHCKAGLALERDLTYSSKSSVDLVAGAIWSQLRHNFYTSVAFMTCCCRAYVAS